MRNSTRAAALTLCLWAACLVSAHAQSQVSGTGTTETTAVPTFTSNDPLSDLLASRGLTQRLEGMRQQMSTTASDLVLHAMGFLGVPYKRGGNSVETGFDCSGFVRAIYEQTVGLVLPRRASEQAQATEVIRREDLKPGDLVFFNTMRRAFSHVGIYVGDGKFIHSPRSGAQVRVEDMRAAYWQTRFNGARRVDMDEATANALVPALTSTAMPGLVSAPR